MIWSWQSWLRDCLKMYKISGDIIKFIEGIMENWRVELTTGGKSLAEVKILRGIFLGNVLSPLLFVIVMMPLNHNLRKCTAGYKLHKSLEKINHLMYMDNIKLFIKNKKEPETLIQAVGIYSDNIRMEYGIARCTMLTMKSRNDKWQKE